jgi:signal transduction histidine kinase
LKIQVVKLPRTETTRDWIRVKIIDSGEGISSENLQRIFTPYFTTKNRGDGKRGFGLGLAISAQIVHLHGGNLSITSLEQKGTTVQIDLPIVTRKIRSRNPKLTDATYESTYRR